MRTPVLLALALAGGFALTWYTLTPPVSTPVAPIAEARIVVPASDRELRATVDALRAEVQDLATRPVPPPVPDEAPLTDDDAEAAMEDIAAHLDEVVAGETRDGEWSAAMEARVANVIRPERTPGATVRELDCRGDICRVVVALESPTAREALAQLSSEMLEPEGQLFGHVQGPDDLEVELYLGRGGAPLPGVE